MDNLYLPDSLYVSIDTHTIRPDTIQSFDVFFKTSERKMVLYCANGGVVKEEVRETIQEHNIENLYILKKDKIYYDLYVEEILSSILNDPKISTPVKAKTAYNSILCFSFNKAIASNIYT